MLKSRHLLFFLTLFYCVPLAAQVDDGCVTDIGKVDFPALENFLRAFRTESYADKIPDFKLSGDVRVDFLSRREHQGPIYFRGGNAHDRNGIPIPNDIVALKTNLRLDYVNDKTWMVSQIEFDNNAGIEDPGIGCKDCVVCPQLIFGSGFCDYLCLKRCYAGYELWRCEDQKITAEIGRRSLYYVFDSRIQYKARVDGVYAKYSNTYAKYEDDRSSNAYLSTAYFLIDKKCNHFGYAAEVGVYNPFDLGFDFKASFINWKKYGLNECGVRNPLGWRFSNVQFNLDYNFREKVYGKDFNIYSAFVVNLAATHETFNLDVDIDLVDQITFERITATNPHKENLGWYVGFIWGDVKKEGDFSFDCNYQYVQAEAVPECDLRGIGRGNANKETFSRTRRGNSNYKGLHAELLYAITDRLQLDVTWDSSRSVEKNVGLIIVRDQKTGQTRIYNNHIFSRFEIELIHAF